MFKKTKGQKGFTIVEAVVSAGVFAFVVAASLGVYIATTQLDSKTRAERAVQQNARFIMDYFAKEIRNGSIDYTGVNDSDTLSITNQLGQQLVFDLVNGNLMLTRSGFGTTQLNSSSISVTRFNLYLRPNVDPFKLVSGADLQPHVTIVMRLETLQQAPQGRAFIDVQTTLTTRDYPSRQ